MSPRDFAPRLDRFSSGIPGLDRVLDGGFFAGGVYIVEGAPGAGKTILANQIAFHTVRAGKRVLYVTLLAESHTRLLQHLQDMTFFDGSAVPEQLTYVSGFRALEETGLKGLLELIRKELRAQNAKVVVLDGFAAVGESAESNRDFKKLVNELQVIASLSSATFFLLSSGLTEDGNVQPVHTMVDGLLRLSDHTFGVRAQRELAVQKFRGSRYLRGVHSFDISIAGIRVHPRLESFSADLADASTTERMAFGAKGIDHMLCGGPRVGSTTMVLGPTGIGKTLLGYAFLACCTPDEPGLLFSFYESPKGAIGKAESIGLDLKTRCETNEIELMWHTPVETSLDVIGGRILEGVDRRKVKRVFVDGFNAFLSSATYPERVEQFFGALVRELRGRAVTTLYAAELHEIFAPNIAPPVPGISPLLDNLMLLRFVEVGAHLRRAISVLKMRDCSFDPALRELRIDRTGLHVGEPFKHSEGVMTGVARRKAVIEIGKKGAGRSAERGRAKRKR